MKTISLFLLVVFSIAARAQEASVGTPLPPLKVVNILNGKQKNIDIASLKGKLVILDFWATWCSPCVAAMSHLETFKKQFGDKLVVLAVSDEPAARLKQFMINRPTTLLVSSDTARSLDAVFPHRTIPHTVLIGVDGKVNAITDAENITPEVLQLALKSVVVNLPVKKDKINFNIDQYFKADTSLPQHFNMLPAVEGAGSMSRVYPEGFFKNRRITLVNMLMDGLYRMAYNKSYYLVKNEYDTVKRKYADEKKYCLDLWVSADHPERLYPFFQQQLRSQFADVDAILEKRKMKALVLKSDSTAPRKLKVSATSNDRYNAGGAHFEGNGVTLNALAEYMEDFGLFAGKVLDETGMTGRYDIFFEWQPEKKESLKTAFANLGLYWEVAEREIEVLVLKRKDLNK